MPIKLKVATTAKELDDVFKLRYEVYVVEKGRFALDSSTIETKGRIVDRFDTIPGVVNIVAYDEHKPVACIRLNSDSEIGLPAEVYFQYSQAREKINLSNQQFPSRVAKIVNVGMLAIQTNWRNRRNIIYSLFKTAIHIMHNMGTTHIISAISEETQSLYGRMGFKAVGQSKWCESIGDRLLPMIASFPDVYKWAFSKDTILPKQSTWLQFMNHNPERILLSKGEALFYQDDIAEHAYVIEKGWISISRTDAVGNELVLSNLSKGELIGELAIFDEQPRSATATAITNMEIIILHRTHLKQMLKENPELMEGFLGYFAKRLRAMDEQAMVQVFAPQTARIQFELQRLWQAAVPEEHSSDIRVAKVGPDQIALSAHVNLDDVLTSLKNEQIEGNLEYARQSIRFLKNPALLNDNREVAMEM